MKFPPRRNKYTRGNTSRSVKVDLVEYYTDQKCHLARWKYRRNKYVHCHCRCKIVDGTFCCEQLNINVLVLLNNIWPEIKFFRCKSNKLRTFTICILIQRSEKFTTRADLNIPPKNCVNKNKIFQMNNLFLGIYIIKSLILHFYGEVSK